MYFVSTRWVLRRNDCTRTLPLAPPLKAIHCSLITVPSLVCERKHFVIHQFTREFMSHKELPFPDIIVKQLLSLLDEYKMS